MNASTVAGVRIPELAEILVEPLVRAALAEDLGRAGDLTTDAIVSVDASMPAVIVARKAGRVAGVGAAAIAFRLLDPGMQIEVLRYDGSDVERGDGVLRVRGSARAVLSAERTALNFLCRLSGIATATHALVEAVRGTAAAVTCTRKTTPGLRALEKYAVRVGGGANHRFGLDDAVLIKDNHIVAAGGIRLAIERVRRAVGHLVKIEIEVDDIPQLREVLEIGGIDAVLLDNMSPPVLRQAVEIARGRVILEASGSVTAETIREIAATGVDVISSGWITHSAPALDFGLDAL
jgi:nicotinate-nucleotide pyrophosphorylase (carboxylating)